MTERFDWFPCYPEKLLGALSAMQPHEGYVYWIVCLRIYEIGGPCGDSIDALSRRTGYRRKVVEDALTLLLRSGKLVRTEAGIINPFAESVLAERVEFRTRAKNRASAGGKKRAEKIKQKQQNGSATSTIKQAPSSAKTCTVTVVEGTQEVPSTTTGPEGAMAPSAAAAAAPAKQEAPDARVFRRGREVLGKNAGGLIRRLLDHHGGNCALAVATLEQASSKASPREYVGRVIAPRREEYRNGFAALALELKEAGHVTIDHEPTLSAGPGAGLLDLPAIPDRRRAR